MAEGRRRLRRGEAVADVAQSLGFADQAHFHRHFTAAYAITPGRYRRLHPVTTPLARPLARPVTTPLARPATTPVTQHAGGPVTTPISGPVNI